MPSKQKRLDNARAIRSTMARDLNAIRDSRIDLSDALGDPGQYQGLRRCRVYDVIRRAPHMGNTGAKKVLLAAKVWPLDRLGEISETDRSKIIKHLPPRAR